MNTEHEERNLHYPFKYKFLVSFLNKYDDALEAKHRRESDIVVT